MSVSCPTCNKQCASEGGLRNHVRMAHGVLPALRPELEAAGVLVDAEKSEELSARTGKTVVVVDRDLDPQPLMQRVIGAAAAATGFALDAVGGELARAVDRVTAETPRPGGRPVVAGVAKGVPVSFHYAKRATQPKRPPNRHAAGRKAKLKHRRARKVG